MPSAPGDPADVNPSGEDPEATPTLVVELDLRSVIVAFLSVLALIVVAAIAMSGTVTTLIVLGVLFAFAVDPVVVVLQTKLRLRRGFAVALLMAGAVLLVGLGIGLLGPQTVEQARSFQQDLPGVVNDLNNLPLVGDQLRQNDVPHKIEDWAGQLPKQLGGDAAPISSAAEAATTLVVAAFGTILLMIGLLVDGPWLADAAVRLVPEGRREGTRRYGEIVGEVIGRYFAGSLVLGGLQGLQVLFTGLILGVPLSPLLAVWAAVWNMVPQIGGAVGGIVFVLVAFTQGATTGIIAAIAFFAYMTFSNNVLLPVILGRAVDVSPLATMAATIGGFFVAGVIGAMLAVPLLGAVKAMYKDVRAQHDHQPKPHRVRRPTTTARVAARVRGNSRPTPAGG